MNNLTNYLLLIVNLTFAFQLTNQESIRIDVYFQGLAKYAALYIPSGYEMVENPDAFLALHPCNVNRWDAATWRDFLIPFAEGE